MMKSPALIFFLILAPALGVAQAQVHEFKLDNGMKVIVKEDRRAPVVVSQVWYKVGSSYEVGGLTGISHALEHMMFKGTEKLEPGEFSRIIAANGGEENAFTGRDYTAYFQKLAKDRLEIALELEADRMRHLRLPADEFAKEIEVVKEERRLRTEDKPEALTYEQFNAGAYVASPYHNPIIGWMSDLDAMTVEDLRDWYRRWYAPNNAVLVVAGDVDPQRVLALAHKHFGPLKREDVVPPKPRHEPEPRGVKRLTVKAPARNPYVVLGFKTPGIANAEQDWEPYALEMLAFILDGGSSSRLSRSLVRGSQVASAAGADYSLFTRLPGMLLMEANPASGHSVSEVEEALLEEVEKLRKDLVNEDELSRIRAQLVAGKVFERDSVFYQAMQIGRLEVIGLGWRLKDEYVERLNGVTPEQIRAVARKYLDEDRMTVAVLHPLPLDGKGSAGKGGS